jgi:hypothetical protein
MFLEIGKLGLSDQLPQPLFSGFSAVFMASPDQT